MLDWLQHKRVYVEILLLGQLPITLDGFVILEGVGVAVAEILLVWQNRYTLSTLEIKPTFKCLYRKRQKRGQRQAE